MATPNGFRPPKIMGLVVVLMLTSAFAGSVSTMSCLHASAAPGSTTNNNGRPLVSSTQLAALVSSLEHVMGMNFRITVVDAPEDGVASARAPCGVSANGSYVVGIDHNALDHADMDGGVSSALIFAHELSHLLQFDGNPSFVRSVCSSTLVDVKIYELLADFGAGYAMYKLGNHDSQRVFPRVIASLADYEFTSVAHHGTVTERLNAFNMGEAAAYFGHDLNMITLMRNQQAFLRLLPGARAPGLESTRSSLPVFTREALSEIYQ